MSATGKVKWFNAQKGYGFVTQDSDNRDIFVHFSAIKAEGYKTLEEGERVSFDTESTPKGARAINVKKI